MYRLACLMPTHGSLRDVYGSDRFFSQDPLGGRRITAIFIQERTSEMTGSLHAERGLPMKAITEELLYTESAAYGKLQKLIRAPTWLLLTGIRSKKINHAFIEQILKIKILKQELTSKNVYFNKIQVLIETRARYR